MTETTKGHIGEGLWVEIEYDYEPPDKDTGWREQYEICAVKHGGIDIRDALSTEALETITKGCKKHRETEAAYADIGWKNHEY